MAILVQDGRRIGHLKWTVEAVRRQRVDGAIISPFCTPRVPRPRHPDASTFAAALGKRAEVLFDPMTHARLLNGTNKVEDYDTWGLWGRSGIGLDTAPRRLEHVELVFERQRDLGLPLVAPTVALTAARSTEADQAVETARIARGLNRDCYQSLAGTADFFASGSELDAYVGRLAGLRAQTWLVTIIPPVTPNLIGDLAASTASLVGWLRTIHSLSVRSRVIVQNADLLGLLAVAAGADTVGTGWDRGMKVFDSSGYQVTTPSPRRPASYVTQARLLAVLRRSIADDLQRLDATEAEAIRGGPMPADEAQQRLHHFSVLRRLVSDVYQMQDRATAVEIMQGNFEAAKTHYAWIDRQIPGLIASAEKDSWVTLPALALSEYAKAEGIL